VEHLEMKLACLLLLLWQVVVVVEEEEEEEEGENGKLRAWFGDARCERWGNLRG
jgi:hypothetical protein